MSVYDRGQLGRLAPGQGDRVGLVGLNPPALARLLARRMEGPLAGGCLLVLVPTALEAEDLVGDLSFFWPAGRTLLMPGFETKPFLGQVVGPGPMAERIMALGSLMDGQGTVVVASIGAALRLAPHPGDLARRTLALTLGDEVGFDTLVSFLADNGYNRVGQVESVADFSVKGGIIDVFPAGQARPVRLDFFGDFVDSIRPFRVDDQRSAGQLEALTLFPACEAPRDAASLASGARGVGVLAGESGWLGLLWEPISRRLGEGLLDSDLDNWGPLWTGRGASLAEFLPGGTGLVLVEPGRLRAAGKAAFLGLQNHFGRLAQEERPHLPLADLFAEPGPLLDGLMAPGRGLWVATELPLAGALEVDREIPFGCETNADLKALTSVPRRATGLLGPLSARVKALLGRGLRVSLVLRTREQMKRLAGLLAEYDLAPSENLAGPGRPSTPEGSLELCVGQLSAGFVAPYDGEAFLAEDEILGARQRPRRRAAEEFRGLRGFAGLKDLSPGDFAVHSEHGIGQYLGLVTLTLSDGQKGDFLHLEYKGGDFLYVPVERFSSVAKYVGATDRPPLLDRLGSGSWEKIKGKVKEHVRQMAEDLLKLYAARQTAAGFAFAERDQALLEFEAAFQYEATADQERSIDEVLRDLSAPKPMDRLVCGDVGYGKTEVAMRAAFKVASEGKQVAVLVPTTILAEQHERSFSERFAVWPFMVASLSRFKKPSQQREILRRLALG
ncbi:MAG: DEAD/DEAH box helicase, partial [Deltaproteobacteria bacterium]|nr:DEAD/DEAH box helicase [Deltaproteobacteria bacterium]